MSGILGCIGTWMPIPGQLFECGMAVVNNVAPGITDLYLRGIDVCKSIVLGIGALGK